MTNKEERIKNCPELIYLFDEDDFECTNDNSYGLQEMRAGCSQNCSGCDYYQPTKEVIDKLNESL